MAQKAEDSHSTLLQELLKSKSKSGTPQVEDIQKIEDVLRKPSLDCISINQLAHYEDLISIVQYVVSPGLVEDFPEKEERDYGAEDFVGVADAATHSFTCLKQLLYKLRFNFQDPKLQQLLLLPILKLCATHSEAFVWSCDEAVHFSGEMLRAVLEFEKLSDVKTLLCQRLPGCENSLFKVILLNLRPMLTRETWTQNASSCHIFKWLLFHVKHPHLSDYLSDVLPPSLMFIDHHAVRNKVLGIHCLEFIIDNVPPTELKMYGRADVVYDALFNLLYMREADVVRVYYPCILKLMSTQEKSHSNPNQARRWCHCDDVYSQFLWNMELEDNIIARREMSVHILTFIQHLGITVIKHLKRTKRVLLAFLSIFEGQEEIARINALEALAALIKIAWPRIEHHCESIIRPILFLVYDVETSNATTDPSVKETVLSCCEECLSLLKQACPLKVKEILTSLDNVPHNIPGVGFFKNVCGEQS